MKIDFVGQTALVTGGTRGIGAAIAKQLVESGATVIATGTNQGHLLGRQSEADAAGLRLRYERVDFADSAATAAFAERMAAEPIDVLINNAGINKLALTGELDMDDWDRIQRVNVRAPTILCRSIAPCMASRGYGRIVNLTSVFGHVSRIKRVSYSTSKFALLGLTRTLALDYAANNVLVNALAPGFIDTELTRSILSDSERAELVNAVPMQRLGSEEEISRVAAFLASSANSFITGQNIIADGGYTSV